MPFAVTQVNAKLNFIFVVLSRQGTFKIGIPWTKDGMSQVVLGAKFTAISIQEQIRFWENYTITRLR